MLIPIGHEQSSVRRLPWVSFTIMGLCLLVWLLCLGATDNEQLITEREQAALAYYFEHPSLHLDAQLKGFQYYQMRQVVRDAEGTGQPGRAVRLAQQAELDHLVAAVAEARRQVPELRWGLVPARLELHAVLTYMFMHAGFLHLLGNLYFFYLVGPYLEDVWGRPLFAAFYLCAGIVAVLGFAWWYPHLDEPLIGASGAVAGTMGAFMVRFGRTKVRFFYTLLLRRWTGTFSAPAWIMLLLWGAREVALASGLWAFLPAAIGNVAYLAHVIGFAFGALVALAVRALDFEERYVDRVVEQRRTVLDNPVIDEAVELARQGKPDEAMTRLQAEVARQPENHDAVAALWHVALGCGRSEQVVARLQPLLRAAARDGELAVVQTFWADMIRTVPAAPVEPAVAVRVVELLSADGDRDLVVETVQWLAPRLGPATPLSLLVRLARLAHQHGLREAGQLVALARSHNRLTPEVARDLDAIAGVAPPVTPAAAGLTGPPPPELEVMAVTPVRLEQTRLTVYAGGERQLDLGQVQAIAAAVIEPAEQASFLVIDLLLQSPATRRRLVRLQSTSFDARHLVGGDEAGPAYARLCAALLSRSGARAMPDAAAVQGRPFHRFASLQAYELATFGGPGATA